jgi:hypothetical protein
MSDTTDIRSLRDMVLSVVKARGVREELGIADAIMFAEGGFRVAYIQPQHDDDPPRLMVWRRVRFDDLKGIKGPKKRMM